MQLAFRLDEKNQTLYADLSPGHAPQPITSLTLQETLAETGDPGLKLDPKTVSEMIAKAQQGKEGSIAMKTLVARVGALLSIISDRDGLRGLRPLYRYRPGYASRSSTVGDQGSGYHVHQFNHGSKRYPYRYGGHSASGA